MPPEFAKLTALPWATEATPLYVYDFAIIAARMKTLRKAMPKTLDIHYAIKANPLPKLLAAIVPLVDGLDVASVGEMDKALDVMAPDRVSFAGPGKRDFELEAAIHSGVTINVESFAEAQRALLIGKEINRRPRLAVRVNPDFELRGSGMKMGGRASPFGVEAEYVPELVQLIVKGGADWRGFHIFAGSQSLDTQAIIDTQAETLKLAARLAEAAGVNPPLVNLGGGFGIPYFPGDTPVDVAAIGKALAKALKKLPESLTDTRFAIELGRWIVGESGVYLARVIDRKISGGETFLIVDGGLNHHLAATGNFGTVVKRNYPVAVAHRMADAAEEVVTIVGPLCTPLDRLADRVALPTAHVGDVIAIFASGAYGASASPSAFLGHAPVREMLINAPR
ncbi:MAG: pyridoxal-dependent decarboxylase, exosortase A system-associated [Pseudomonadota bacterium]